MVELAHEVGIALREDRVQDRQHGRPLLAGGGAGGRAPHEVHDASLPGGPREHLLDGAPEALVGIRGHARDAGDAPPAQRPQEGEPAGVALRVDRVDPEQAAVAVRPRAYGRDERARRDMAPVAALDVGCVHPDVGERHVGGVPLLQVGHRLVQRLADPRDLARAHAVDAHGGRHALDLPRGNAARHHLGDRRDHRPIDPGVADQQVLREVAPAPELGDAQVDRPDAGDERALAISVALVAVGARVLRLHVHDLVDEGLRHDADELPDVDHAVVESRHLVV